MVKSVPTFPPRQSSHSPLPSAPTDFPGPGTWCPRRVLLPPEARAHSGSLLCELTGVHTNPPAGFLLLWIQESEPAPHGEGGPGQVGQVAHPSPALSTPKPSRGTKERRRWLTFRGSPLFGLQRRECAHDGPHGSEDLCATWDPGPCPSPPLERNQCGSSTPNWRREKSTRQLARSLVFSERGAGALGTVSFLLQPRTCTDSQGPAAPGEPSDPGPAALPAGGRGRCPEACLALDTGLARPPGTGSRARAACGAGVAHCPPLLPHARRPLPALARAGSRGAEYQS